MYENEYVIPLGTPFELPEYKLGYLEENKKLSEEVEIEFERAIEANRISDRYICHSIIRNGSFSWEH
jgi:hypothetical protein